MKTIIKQTLPVLLALCMHGCIVADYQTDISWIVENKTDRTITVSVMKSSSGGDSRTLAPGGKMDIAPEQSLFDSKRKISRTASFAYMPAKREMFRPFRYGNSSYMAPVREKRRRQTVLQPFIMALRFG
ncbi:MAG: hypothetical protein L6V35_03455 [Alistipes putredinis]|nr:MAG: hypothetical protein L6V35_03455 [Alistipes putredinis]